jgi:hypothetical protein
MLLAWIMACVATIGPGDTGPDTDTDTGAIVDTGFECAPRVSYVWHTEPDCGGDEYGDGGGSSGTAITARSIYSVTNHWCMNMDAEIVDAVPMCP